MALVLFLLVLAFAKIGYSFILSSSMGQFKVHGFDNGVVNTTYLNWTNNYNNIFNVSTNTTFNGTLIVRIWNETSGLIENYTQRNSVSACQNNSLILIVRNSTLFSNTIEVNGTFNVSFTMTNCLPGRYYTNNFTIANLTQQNESANFTVILDIPINNTIQTTGIGTFNGEFAAGNNTYQSYYFNTSLIPNATSVTLTLSGWSSPADVDVFLVDDSTPPAYKARSANKTAATETLRYQYLPKDKFWEIRVFGNFTSAIVWSGSILYSTLNITNPADSNSQISLLNVTVNNNALNATQTNNTNITIRNSGNISFSNVAESKELYYTRRFVGNTTNNYSFIVPDSSVFNRVKVLLNWTGMSNYSFNVYDVNENLVAYAANQYAQANVSGVAAEIYNETGSMNGNTGKWIVEVKNNTNATNDYYNLTVLMYVNSSAWIATNYSTYSFNRTGNNNYTTDVSINFTIPNNSVDGIYEGRLLYLDGNNAGINLPIWLNVTSPVLSVNNSMNSVTYRIDENVLPAISGTVTNLTRVFTFVINNSGSYPMTLNFTKSPGTLNFTFNSTNGTLVPANSIRAMNVSIGYNSSNFSAGVYEGAIYINATNETAALSSHPYQSLNLTLDLNLTQFLTVNVSQLMSNSSNNVANATSGDNVTAKFRVFFINGTLIEESNLTTSNVSIWMVETNTSYRIPTSPGNLTISNGTNPLYTAVAAYGDGGTKYYHVNASIPANQIGGRYDVHALVYFTNGSTSYYGEGVNRSLIINNTGLKNTAMNSTSISLANQTSSVFAVNVTNYGPITASGAALTFVENCSSWSISAGPTYSNCGSSFAPIGYNSSCVVSWTITAGSDNASSCTGYIVGDPPSIWFNPNETNVSVSITKDTSGSSSTTSSSAASAAAAAAAAQNISLAFTVADPIIYVEQNKTNTSVVQVKNTGASTQTVTLSIDTLASSWYSINYTNSTSLWSGKVVGYTVTFNPGNADMKDYPANFKANGSASSATYAFKLRVLPSAEKKTEISSIVDQLNSNFTALSAELNKTKAEGKNVTVAQQKFDMLQAKLDQANTYIKNGDYFSAYQLVSDIKNLYSETKDALSKSTAAGSMFDITKIFSNLPSYLIYILIGGAVGVGAFVAYLFWPTKAPKVSAYAAGGTKPIIGPPAPKKPLSERFGFVKTIKEFFSKIFNRGSKQTYQVR
jgi:hypothetical protein